MGNLRSTDGRLARLQDVLTESPAVRGYINGLFRHNPKDHYNPDMPAGRGRYSPEFNNDFRYLREALDRALCSGLKPKSQGSAHCMAWNLAQFVADVVVQRQPKYLRHSGWDVTVRPVNYMPSKQEFYANLSI